MEGDIDIHPGLQAETDRQRALQWYRRQGTETAG